MKANNTLSFVWVGSVLLISILSIASVRVKAQDQEKKEKNTPAVDMGTMIKDVDSLDIDQKQPDAKTKGEEKKKLDLQDPTREKLIDPTKQIDFEEPAAKQTDLQMLAPPDMPDDSADMDSGLDFADMDLEKLLMVPLVEAASRRRQSLNDAPVSITVITAEEIASSSASTVAELLYRIPGMYVGQTAAKSFALGMRGLFGQINNRILVLVDGQNVADRLNGYYNLGAMAIHPMDVDRIEVIRGPGSTLYGSDALSGVVNIVTKSAIADQTWIVQAHGLLATTSTPEGKFDPWMANGGGAFVSYAFKNQARTMGLRLSFNLNSAPEWPESPTIPVLGIFHYGVNARFDYRIGEDWDLSARIRHTFNEHLFSLGTISEPNTFNVSSQMVSLQLKKRNLFIDSLNLDWLFDAGRSRSETFGPIDLDDGEKRILQADNAHSLLLLNLSLWEGKSIISLGGEFTYFFSQEFFTKPWFFFSGLIVNTETRLFEESLVIHLGGRVEQVIAEEPSYGRAVHRSFSPRAAVIFKFSENHNLRFSLAHSFRVPTPFDSFTRVTAEVYGPPYPDNIFVFGNPRLQPEQIYSVELGYRGMWFESLRLDLVVFGQQVENLIGIHKGNSMPRFKENLDDQWHLGTELGLRYNPTSRLSAYFSYTFTYSMQGSDKHQFKEFPLHLYSAGAELRLPWRNRLNLDTYFMFDHKPNIIYTRISGTQFNDWEDRQSADRVIINLRYGHFMHHDELELFISMKNLVGLFRDTEGLRILAIDKVSPVGATFMMGLQLTGI